MKQTLIPEERVLEEVRKAIWEGLDTDPARVQPESSLIGDLGAESLDFLDINFRLEQTFGIKTARHSVIEHMEEMFGEESAIDSEGKLTEKAVKVLGLRFNDSADQLRAGMDMEELPRLVTVRSIADGVLDILDSLPPNCTSCGKAQWGIEKESRIQCGSCAEPAGFTEGDELVDAWLAQIQAKEKIF